MGLTITITCVAEVPVFFFTGWLLEAVGVNIMLHGVLAVYILRLSYYSILQYMVRALGPALVSCSALGSLPVASGVSMRHGLASWCPRVLCFAWSMSCKTCPARV